MMSKETLKKLGILGVSFGLIASPLAFGDMHEDPAAQSTDSAADPMSQQADPATGDPAAGAPSADPNAQGDPAVPGDDPATQSTDSAADPSTQQADPAAGEPNAQGDPAQDPGFGEGTEAMPGADDSAAGGEEEYEYENEEQEAPWDEEGDSSEDEEQGG
ncbi:hypothetical protein [Halomonas sp.]|uniref:hypothetical protein n=1 Tax=Halomonas sp. TaxID=1486246 RepID=UPI00298D62C5|nr:hypothetical protein [Halomonas sp.]MDW7747111.1 hypothetical protein [Halomonas sp.]